MTMTKIADYKGFEIKVTENGRFYAYHGDDQEAFAVNYDDLLTKLDKISKKKVTVDVFLNTYSKIVIGTLTSVKEEEGYSGKRYYARVTVDNTSRQESTDIIYSMTKENSVLATQFNALHDTILKLQKESEEILKKMTRINIQELLK